MPALIAGDNLFAEHQFLFGAGVKVRRVKERRDEKKSHVPYLYAPLLSPPATQKFWVLICVRLAGTAE